MTAGDTSLVTPVSAGWLASSTNNGVFPDATGHLKLQVYDSTCYNWIVSPSIEMGDNMQLTFDLALTQSTGSLTPAEAGQQADDKFAVLITTDGGENWTEVFTRDNVSTDPTYDQISCTAEGEIVSIDLTEYASNKIAFAFYGESTVAGGNNYLHIANVRIDTIPACEKPMGLVQTGKTSMSATFEWDEIEDAATWEYGVVVDTFAVTDFVPAEEDFTGSTEEYSATIDTLQENTKYIFFVRRDCGEAHSDYLFRRFRTNQTPATLPFEDDFEGAENWVLLNGEMTNNWVIGSATNNGGEKSLYVSDDHGTTNKYSHGATTIYATKTFEIEEEGKYNASYDWKGQGESTWDLIRVALAPAEVDLEAGSALPAGLSSTSGNALGSELPAGWISLDGGKLNLQSNWQHNSVDADLTPGTYKVVIIWRNDGSGGTQTPAGAIDNFKFAQVLCVRPENLKLAEGVDSIATNSALIDWEAQGSEANWLVQYKKSADAEWTAIAEPVTAHPFLLEGLQPSTSYDVQVAAWCNPADSATISDYSATFSFATECAAIASFPYSEKFDGMEGTTGTQTLPICWNFVNTSTYSSNNYYPMVYKGATYANSGTNSLKFYSTAYSSSYDPQDIYAVLPEMEGLNALRMKFNARANSVTTSSYSVYDATFTVGVMTDPADTATFVAVATMNPATTTYEPFEVKFNTYEGTGKYIAIKMAAAEYDVVDYRGFYMDDIVIDSIPDCFEPTALKVVETTTNSVKFTYTAAAEGDSLSYAVVLAGVEPTEFIGVTADTVLVEGLNGSTEYEIYLRTECANSHSLVLSKVFQTKQVAVDMGNSFFEDFEGPNTWYGFNTAANAWVRGEAAHNGEGTHALYVSNDGGETNGYSKSGPGIIYAAKLLNIEGGSYVFQFDWRAKGEGTTTLYDYMRAALVPAAAELVAGSTVPTGFAATTLPEGCIAIDNSQALNQSDAWQTSTSDEVTVPAGTYYLAFGWKWDSSSGSDPAAAIDNISINKVLCGKPGTPTIEKANITATSAEIAWVCDPEQTAWDLAMDTIAAFNPDSVELIAVSTNPYLAENLLPEHTYYVYVRANCGDNFSAWSARASFKTAKACQKPDGLDVTAITDSSAVITWNTYGQNDFILTYGIGNAYADTVEVTGGSYSIVGLEPNTSYKVKVAAACDENTFSSAKTFKTLCAPATTVVENFDGITGQTSSNVLPDCWSYLNGGSSYGYLPTAYAGATYANSGSNSLKFYNYASTSYADQYAILPAVEALNTLRMKFNARKYSASYEGTLVVGIMTDPADAATFVAIDTIRPAAATYEPFVVSFGEYAGEGMYAAFKLPIPATSYNGAYIDDVELEEIPSCLEPSNLAITALGAYSASFSWTSEAAAWQVAIDTVADFDPDSVALIDVTEAQYTLENLNAGTAYYVYVRANCGDAEQDDFSPWSNLLSFKTAYAVPFEEQFASSPTASGEWIMATGLLSDVLSGEAQLASATYGWSFVNNTTGVFGSEHIYCNIYGTTSKKWIISPAIEVNGNVQLSFDMALTKSSTAHTAITAGNQADDKFAVLITTDNGTTWSVLRQWDNTGSADVYDNISTDGAEYTINLSAYSGHGIYFAFYGESTVSGGDNYLHIDNVLIDIIPACPKTTGLHIEALGANEVTLAWDAEEDVTWEYGLVLDTVENFVPADADFTAIADTNVVTIDGLTEQSAYLFFFRKVCGEDKSDILYKDFKTTQTPAAIPFADDFEDGNSWLLINGNLTNAWVVGNATNNGGASSLYISNDGGLTNAYTNTSATAVYAAKAFNFVADTATYVFTYDWNANGEAGWDFLRVVLAPANVELEAGTSLYSGLTKNNVPAGWFALDGGLELSAATDWSNKSVELNVSAGIYNVVFVWKNDGSGGSDTPAAIDNFSIAFKYNEGTGFDSYDATETNAVKFIKNQQIYILHNGVVYDITGRKVEVK